MTIDFKKNYGFAPAAPFWVVMDDELGPCGNRFTNPDDAEQYAATLAADALHSTYHVLAVVATIKATAKISGERFDPHKLPPRAIEIEPAPLPDVEECPPVAADTEEPF